MSLGRCIVGACWAMVWIAGWLAVGSGCMARKAQPAGQEVRAAAREAHEEHEGEARKRWSGRSYLDQTQIATMPSPSALGTRFDAERAWSGHDDWEPAVAADPGSSNVYQMTTRYGSPCAGCPDPVLVFRKSTDGGATWGPDQYFVPSKRAQNDPQLAVARDGTIYTAFLTGYRPGVMFSKSRDQGRTFTKPVRVTGKHGPRWSDKPALVVSPDGQHVYVAFNASDSYVVASHDHGESFAPPVQTSDDGRYWFHYQGAIAPDGTVYFVAVDYSQDYRGHQNIQVIRSTDRGRTWTTTRIDTAAEPVGCAWAEGCYFGFFGASASLAVDSAGTLMVGYTAGNIDGAPPRLHVRTSKDGVTWSQPEQIGAADVGVIHGFPVLAAGPAPGDFHITWMDDRNGTTSLWNTWYRHTTDGGQSWSQPVRLSDQAGSAPYKHPQGYAFTYGDYYEMDVDTDGTVHVIWGAGASYTGPGGIWYTRGDTPAAAEIVSR